MKTAKYPERCQCGCKNNYTVVLALLWGAKEGELKCCDKHLPAWAKGLNVGDFSPVATLFGITKSFYQVKSIV